MKSKVLLFSTRDIGLIGTLFENANPQVCKELCSFFIKTNEKELNELKRNILSVNYKTSDAEKPSIDTVYDKIVQIYGDDLPTEINEAYADGLDALISTTEQILKNNPNEDLSEFLLTVKGGEPIVPSFDIKDFNNESLLIAPAINIEKSEKTLKERVSIYSLNEVIDKDINNSDVKYQVFAVWSLGEGVSDSSWEETLVKSVLEQVKNAPADQMPDELEIFLFLHDKDLERTYNKPFKTEYVKRKYNDEVINVVCTFTSFTHADFEYTRIKNGTDVALSTLFTNIEIQTSENAIFQMLLGLSDQLANWQGFAQKDMFASDLVSFVSEENWNGVRWKELRETVNQIRAWNKLTDKEKRKTLLELNNKINKEIKELRKKRES